MSNGLNIDELIAQLDGLVRARTRIKSEMLRRHIEREIASFAPLSGITELSMEMREERNWMNSQNSVPFQNQPPGQ